MTRLDGFVVYLAHHDVMLWAASRAPLAKLQAYKRTRSPSPTSTYAISRPRTRRRSMQQHVLTESLLHPGVVTEAPGENDFTVSDLSCPNTICRLGDFAQRLSSLIHHWHHDPP
jgi:hypothetical protein